MSDWDTPIRHQIHRKGISAEAKKWKPKRYLALCDTVSPSSAKPKACFIWKMALDAKPAFSMANFQRATTYILSKRKIPQRHACKSETLAQSMTANIVQKSQLLRSRVGLSFLVTSYCPLLLSPPPGIWQVKCPCPLEFAIHKKKKPNSLELAWRGWSCVQLELTDA